jgi:hypothetical protein
MVNSIVRKLSMIFLYLLPLAAFAQDEVSITMSLSKDVISVDDQVYLTITVAGTVQNLPSPELPNLSMFDVYSQGTATNFTIVNGSMESSMKYNYILSPRKEGTFVIKPAVIAYNRKRYESNEIVLKVVDSKTAATQVSGQDSSAEEGQTRDVFLTAELDKKTAYVGQQITLTVKFCHAVQIYSQPDYTAPQTTDFWTDMLEPQKSYYQIINNKRYNVIEINSALFPTRSGELSIGRAMVKTTVAGGRRTRRTDPFSIFDDFFTQGETITVRSNTLKVNVLPLPLENKPDNFSGTVGDFKISSSADKKAVDVNQPVTVTYKISGTGNIKTIAEPQIGDLKDFRVYRSSSSEKISKLEGVVGGTKIFEEVYIPKRAGTLVIPPVSLDFFDPAEKKYEAISTTPIQLAVRPPSGAEAEYADIPFRPVAGRVVDTEAKDIRYIKTSNTVYTVISYPEYPPGYDPGGCFGDPETPGEIGFQYWLCPLAGSQENGSKAAYGGPKTGSLPKST